MIKKYFTLLLILLLILVFAGCVATSPKADNNSTLTAQLSPEITSIQSSEDITSITDYVGTNEKGEYRLEPGGGDGNDWFYSQYIPKVNSIESLWYNLVDEKEFELWVAAYDKNWDEIGGENALPFLVAYLQDMQITREQCDGVVAYMAENDYWGNPNLLRPEDLDIIFTWDAELINQTYATEYSVYANGKVYSPQWILNHTAEDYKAAGITAQQLEPKMQKYLEELGPSHATYQTMYTQKLNDLKALEK